MKKQKIDVVIDAVDNASGKIDKVQGSLNKFTGGLTSSAIKLSAYAMAAKVVWDTVEGLVSPIVRAGIAAETLNVTLKAATGSAQAGAFANQFLADTADRLGLSFTGLASGFVTVSAAAAGTTLEGQKAKDIFEAVSTASGALRLSTEQTQGALLAIGQMISKGTVQAEELRGQLGERLPGAFQIAAKAMGVTTAELGKMLEQGQVISTDFLPKFAAALKEKYAGAAVEAAASTEAAVTRMQNAWTEMMRNLGGVVLPAVSAAVVGINEALKSIAPTTTQGKIEALTNKIETLQTRIAQPLHSGGLKDDLREAQEELKKLEYLAAGVTSETGQWAKGPREMAQILNDRFSKGDFMLGTFQRGKDAALERSSKDETAAFVAEAAEMEAAAKRAASSGEAALKKYQDQLKKTTLDYAKLTMSASEYERLQLTQAYEEEAAVLGKNNAMLNDAYKIKLSLIAANERLADPMNKPYGATDSFMGLAEADERGAADLLELETKSVHDREQLEISLTESINKLTMTELDYKLWALDTEMEKLREVAGEDLTLRGQVSAYYMAKIKEIETAENRILVMTKHVAKEMEKSMSSLFFDVITGKFNSFADFLTGLMNTIAKMVSDQMARIAREIMFGREGSSMGGIVGEALKYMTSSGTSYAKHHSGGVVGVDAPSGYANVSPLVFAGAPRLHSGLAADEFPAILQKGETVIPKGGGMGNVTVNVHNNTGGKIDNPKIEFDARGMILDIVLDGYARDVGGFRTGMGGR